MWLCPLRCEKVFPWILIGNLLNRSPLLSSESARLFGWKNQEEMSYEGTPVKAPPTSRRRMMPPTPQQSSHSSLEDMRWRTEMETQGSGSNARDRTVTARMEQYLNASDCMKLEIEELELPLCSEDAEGNT